MALVCKSPSKINSNCTSNAMSSDLIRKANQHLLYKEFDSCLEVCLKGIGTAKNLQEQDSSSQTIEALCVLATQAYAELNRWQEVLPFVTQLYNGIEDCPAKVVQLCVLLHAHMKDFTACSAIAHIWLRNPNNTSNAEYTKLIEIFITRVLQRQNRLADVPAFLDSCPGLYQKQKDVYKRYADDRESYRKAEAIVSETPKTSASDQSIVNAVNPPKEDGGLLHTIGKSISRFIPPVAWHLIKRIALLSIFLYWIFTRANFGLLSNPRLMGIFSAVIRLWKSMFAPYYTSK